MSYLKSRTTQVNDIDALPGHAEAVTVANCHYVNGHSMLMPYPADCAVIDFAMGCFRAAEPKFWSLDGVYLTIVGYSGGYTVNPRYQEVGSGQTGHAEVVRVVYDRKKIALVQLLNVFWEMHDPTQGMQQGVNRGTQYRSAIYTEDEDQYRLAVESRSHYQALLIESGQGTITTEIRAADTFYYAEEVYQQYYQKIR